MPINYPQAVGGNKSKRWWSSNQYHIINISTPQTAKGVSILTTSLGDTSSSITAIPAAIAEAIKNTIPKNA